MFYYVNNFELLNFCLTYLIENIEIWNQNLFFKLAESLYATIQYIIKLNNTWIYENLLNLIIKFFIKVIINEQKELSNEYLRNFQEIVEILTESCRIKISREIIEMTISMGSFGMPIMLRRFSTYFCSSLIRVI